ncbi:MAG: hypothetical protein HFJ10_03105 [Lachnospiraceae bacterium]|jgi:phage shock protein PspC (stress-responsive transcriptional regulator)|nr:hypothetical protein [Lachnospiraceae bacterium]
MSQKKKKTLFILGIIAGLIVQFIGITVGAEHLRMISGICIGIGAVLFSLAINGLYRLSFEKEFPEAVRQEKIEQEDERNIQIRNRAKARSSDIIRWVLIGIGWLNFLIRGSLWITLALIGVFVLVYVLDWFYMDKYQREM